ncbi:unnamed protein product [Anisakis simplex]|uniref:Uncharacterized protein n=1 Tax=Anisakis simplex TaxID=6269 RepID=A0A3P6NQE5_ANISI|nr:unnamed protein product [Anisakis simplex]
MISFKGYKQVILLGQNVNSYRDQSEQSTYHSLSATDNDAGLVPGFKTVYKPRKGGLTFVTLLEQVAAINPELRIRFTSPHPKDFPVQWVSQNIHLLL